MDDRRLGLLTIGTLVASLLLAGCGPSPPAYDQLADISVATNCGGVYSAADLVHLAYDGAPFENLPEPVPVPDGTVQAGGRLGTASATGRLFPCADDADAASTRLSTLGYTRLSLSSENDRMLIFQGRDPFGIDGLYAVYRCDFVGDLDQVLTGNYFSMGVLGAFAGPGARPDVAVAQEFAALSLRTGLINAQSTTGYIEQLVYLDMEDQYTVRTFDKVDHTSLDVCAVWVEPNLWGGCDAVSVGDAFLLAEDDGSFQMLPFIGSPVYTFAGYCGRTE